MSYSSMLRFMKKQETKTNSKYSTESLYYGANEMYASEEFAVELIKIQQDNSTSLEHWDNLLKRTMGDLTLMSHMTMESIRERNMQKRMLREMRDSSFSIEQCNEVANIMSMEGVKEWGKAMWEKFKALLEKVGQMFATFFKWLWGVIRAQWAKTQTKLYKDNKDKIAAAITKEGGQKAKYKKYSFRVSDLDNLVSTCENAVKEVEELEKKDVTSGSYDSESIKTAGEALKKAIPAMSDNSEDGIGVAARKMFFDKGEKVKSAEHPINDLLSAKEFEACSEEYLKKISKIQEQVKKMITVTNKAKKKIDEAMKKWEAEDKKAENSVQKGDKKKEYKEGKKAFVKQLNSIINASHMYQSYTRSVILHALDYRSTIYRLAKMVLKKDSGDKKDEKKEEKK